MLAHASAVHCQQAMQGALSCSASDRNFKLRCRLKHLFVVPHVFFPFFPAGITVISLPCPHGRKIPHQVIISFCFLQQKQNMRLLCTSEYLNRDSWTISSFSSNFQLSANNVISLKDSSPSPRSAWKKQLLKQNIWGSIWKYSSGISLGFIFQGF